MSQSAAPMDDSEKTKLTPANDNPWYWLVTVYGEQTCGVIHGALAEENRIAWNRWVAEDLSEETRMTLIGKGFDEVELKPFTMEEKVLRRLLKMSGLRPNLRSSKIFFARNNI